MKTLFSLFLAPLIALGFMVAPASANHRTATEIVLDHATNFNGFVPLGIEKRLESGKELPPGIEKKLQQNGTMPTIFNVMVTARSESSARIMWVTDEPADTSLWLSASAFVNLETAPRVFRSELSIFHTAEVTGLSPGTMYFYIVGSRDSSGNITYSEVRSFETADSRMGDAIAPHIVHAETANITVDSATVRWETDEQTTGRVLLSRSIPVVEDESQVFLTPGLGMEHAVQLTGLESDTVYYFVIEAEDGSGNKTRAETRSFATLSFDSTHPEIFGPFVIQVDEDNARIIWATNERSDSMVWLSQSSPVNTTDVAVYSSSESVYFHSANLENLAPNTSYHYIVRSSDNSGNTNMSAEGNFMTDAQ